MKNYETNWSKDELKAYILVHCANADFDASPVELSFIKEHTQIGNLEDIEKEYAKDSDFESLQKMQWSLEHHGYSEHEIEALLNEIKTMFNADDKFSTLEKNLLIILKRLFKAS